MKRQEIRKESDSNIHPYIHVTWFNVECTSHKWQTKLLNLPSLDKTGAFYGVYLGLKEKNSMDAFACYVCKIIRARISFLKHFLQQNYSLG